jgi:4-diphosphocytidyl-2-C-methyl-D-erythritol kinase
MVIKKAYAKINLALEVKNKIDGYHKVNNVMIPIDLYDEIVLKIAKKDSITCGVEIENNICEKALKLFKERFGIDKGVSIFIIKRIPVMAGLAGGSTDAAATLMGLVELFNLEVSNKELFDLAKELGSDVPFFISNQLALCTNRG